MSDNPTLETSKTPLEVTVYFDFVDPLSFLAIRMTKRLVEQIRGLSPWTIHLLPFELRPPPEPMLSGLDSSWRSRWEVAQTGLEEAGISVVSIPVVVPWTRKAHELLRYAQSLGLGNSIREAIFKAYLESGSDIGRVDVLVQIAERAGLDRSETKAVLDIDRYTEEVLEVRQQALAKGIRTIPTVLVGESRLEGEFDSQALHQILTLP